MLNVKQEGFSIAAMQGRCPTLLMTLLPPSLDRCWMFEGEQQPGWEGDIVWLGGHAVQDNLSADDAMTCGMR